MPKYPLDLISLSYHAEYPDNRVLRVSCPGADAARDNFPAESYWCFRFVHASSCDNRCSTSAIVVSVWSHPNEYSSAISWCAGIQHRVLRNTGTAWMLPVIATTEQYVPSEF